MNLIKSIIYLASIMATTASMPIKASASDSFTMYVTIADKTLEAEMVDNSSTRALKEQLLKGDITYEADDYGGFEKVGNLGYNFPQNNEPINAQPGDVILYLGNSLCLYYGNNSWNFTRMGRLRYDSIDSLKSFLEAGRGRITVRLSLTSTSGIVTIAQDEKDSDAVVYYDLNGRKVSEGTKGILIRRTNGHASKIVNK